MGQTFIEASQAGGRALFSRNITGEVVMLNLLRFRDIADYSAHPETHAKPPHIRSRGVQKIHRSHLASVASKRRRPGLLR